MKAALATAVLFLASASAVACMCPVATQSWWDRSQNVALVRMNAVRVAAQGMDGGPCVDGEPCALQQAGSISVIETYKGRVSHTRLNSGYGSGDCGMPLVAGAYYVVFLRDDSDRGIGICNAAGPYPPRRPFSGRYPVYLEKFVASLRQAAKNPAVKVAPRPPPMTYDTMGGR